MTGNPGINSFELIQYCPIFVRRPTLRSVEKGATYFYGRISDNIGQYRTCMDRASAERPVGNAVSQQFNDPLQSAPYFFFGAYYFVRTIERASAL